MDCSFPGATARECRKIIWHLPKEGNILKSRYRQRSQILRSERIRIASIGLKWNGFSAAANVVMAGDAVYMSVQQGTIASERCGRLDMECSNLGQAGIVLFRK